MKPCSTATDASNVKLMPETTQNSTNDAAIVESISSLFALDCCMFLMVLLFKMMISNKANQEHSGKKYSYRSQMTQMTHTHTFIGPISREIP